MNKQQLEFPGFIKHEYLVEVNYDECAECPRDWDNAFKIITKNGCKYIRSECDEGLTWYNREEDREKLENTYKHVYPISVYDHSGVSFSLGEASGWDCGQIGWMVSDEELNNPQAVAEEELETYNMWCNGEVIQLTLYEDGEELDSISGIYAKSDSEIESEARAYFGCDDGTISIEWKNNL